MNYKTIKCDCGNDMKIPIEMDEDYHKNEYPCVLYGDEVKNGARCDPDMGGFVCNDCYKNIMTEVHSEEDFD